MKFIETTTLAGGSQIINAGKIVRVYAGTTEVSSKGTAGTLGGVGIEQIEVTLIECDEGRSFVCTETVEKVKAMLRGPE